MILESHMFFFFLMRGNVGLGVFLCSQGASHKPLLSQPGHTNTTVTGTEMRGFWLPGEPKECAKWKEGKEARKRGRKKKGERGQLKSKRLKAERRGCGEWEEEDCHRGLGGGGRVGAEGKQGQCLCLCHLCHCGILEDRGAMCPCVSVCACA